ncbi:MAG TPA: hypothetical protein VNR38_15720 [Ureibacillus sp.]|nr:hypothetical protein [Ureibacillus sp.]
MRTSRVHAVTNSIFRNSRQYLQTNERIFRLLDEGEENRKKSKDHRNGKENQKNHEKQNAPVKLIRKKRKGILIKGIQSDANSMALLHNALLRQNEKLNQATRKTHIRTYRSSI